MSHAPATDCKLGDDSPVDFLWLELTNRCNLRCVHCYAESGPENGDSDLLTFEDYVRVLDEAHLIGCRRVQFIGGEPTLNRDLERLISHANGLGFEFIEVFMNLTRLPKTLLTLLVSQKVHVATSVYASTAGIHDKITTVSGSFARTIANIRTLISAGVPVRAGVIAMEENKDVVNGTVSFLRNLGVSSVGSDTLRKIGRAGIASENDISQLCGECAGGTLCVGPDGLVSPCIMSKAWSIGSLATNSLLELINSTKLRETRKSIHKNVVDARRIASTVTAGKRIEAVCTPKVCGPYDTCSPSQGPGPCAPSGCTPCYPKG